MKKAIRIFIIGFGILLALWYVHNAIYPFSTSHPNFSDVERVFNKMQFPDDWQEIRSSENRGVAGRMCPIESESACYHRSKLFVVAKDTKQDAIERVLKLTNCPAVSYQENAPVGGVPYDNYTCSTEGLTVSGTLYKKNSGWEASFSVSTR